MATIRNIITRFGADTAEFEAGTKRLKDNLTTINRAFFENNEKLKAAQKEVRAYQKELKGLNDATQGGASATVEQKARMGLLTDQISRAKLSISQLKTEEQDLKGQIKSATSALHEHQQGIKNTGDQSQKASGSVGQLGTALKALIFGYTGKKLFEVLIGSNAEMEQYITSFEVMLGDAAKADDLMRKLTDFAGKTPLELPDATKSAQLLMNYGVAADDVINKLTRLGDLSGGNAEKLNRVSLAYGQMLAKGKVTGEELRQMTEAGVPLLQTLADTMGKSTAELQKMISAGAVGIPELDRAIESLTTGSGKFAGMMERQSQTMNGILSSLKNDMAQFGRDAGEEAFGTVKDSLTSLLKEVRKAQETGDFDKMAKDWGRSIGEVATNLASAIKLMWEYRDVIIAGGAAWASYNAATTVIPILAKLATGIHGVMTAQTSLNAVLMANPYVAVAAALAAVTGAVVLFANDSDDAARAISDMRKEIESTDESLRKMETDLKDIQTGGIGGAVQGMTELSVIADNIIPKIEQLRIETGNAAGDNALLREYIDKVNEALGYTAYSIDVETGALKGNTTEIYKNIDALRARITLEASTERLLELEGQRLKIAEDLFEARNKEAELTSKINEWTENTPFHLAPTPKMVWDKNKAAENRKDLEGLLEKNLEVIDGYEKQVKERSEEIGKLFTDTLNGTAPSTSLPGGNRYTPDPKEAYTRAKESYNAGLLAQQEYIQQVNALIAEEKKVIDELYGREDLNEEQQGQLSDALKNYNTYISELESLQKKNAASGSANSKTSAAAQADYFKLLQLQRDVELISLDEYYKEVEKLAKESKERVDALYSIKNRNAEQQKALQDSLEEYKKYYSELEKRQAEALKNMESKEKEEAAALKNWISEKTKEYNEYYKARKTLADKAHKEEKERIQEELKAEEARINALIDSINKEIEARRRLQEETDYQKEMEAVAARLKYEQLDEFTRQELERRLARLQAEQEEREWQNAKSDEKDTLKEELNTAKELASAEIDRINKEKELLDEMFEDEKARVQEIFDHIGKNFKGLSELERAGIESLNDIFMVATESEREAVDETFSKIKKGTLEVADLYASTVSKSIKETFDKQVERAKAAIAELDRVVSRAESAARNAYSSNNTVNSNNTTSAKVSISNPYYTPDQIAQRVIGAIMDPF